MKKIVWICSVIFSLVLLVSCNKVVPVKSDKIIVAVGIVPQATFVSKVAGDLVEIITLIPPGNSPANYQPSAREMEKLSDASIYFTMQMPTEEANILPKVKDFNKNIIIVNLRETTALKYPLLSADHHHGEEEEHEEEEGVDPHLWLSPRRAAAMVEEIAVQLSLLDPSHTETYRANAEAYIKEIQAIDLEIEEILSTLDNRSFIIYHGSYGYFSDDYKLNMIAIEIAGKKATAAEMQKVIDLAEENKIDKVFYQEEFDDTQARTVASEIGGSVSKVSPLSPDYLNSLLHIANTLKE